jgi:hypothetical protein
MPSQFLHIGAYGRAPKKNDPSWASIDGVTSEGMRMPGASKHIPLPASPRVILGEEASVAAEMATRNAIDAVDADGRKLRKDGIALYAGVISYPVSWAGLDLDANAHDKMHRWFFAAADWLKDKFGKHLKSAIVHTDETYPHLHFFVVPPLGLDRRIDHGTAHPAHLAKRTAEEKALSEGSTTAEARKAGNRAYVAALRALQDDFHQKVSRRFGHARFGDRKTRVSRVEKKAEIEAEALKREVFDRAYKDAIRIENEAYDRGLSRAERAIAEANKRVAQTEALLAAERQRAANLEAELATLRAATNPGIGSRVIGQRI